MRNENNTHVVLTQSNSFKTSETQQCLSACQMGKILITDKGKWLVDFGLKTVVWVREGQGVPITVGKNGRANA